MVLVDESDNQCFQQKIKKNRGSGAFFQLCV